MKRPPLLPTLNILKTVLFLVMVLMFINFSARIAQNTATTKQAAVNTQSVVKGQVDILKAIKQVTDDTHITAAQQTAIIICMLQVPVDQRTTDLQTQCRKQATDPVNSGTVSGTSNSGSQKPAAASSPQSAPTPAPAQSNSSQSSGNPPQVPKCTVDILFLHVGKC